MSEREGIPQEAIDFKAPERPETSSESIKPVESEETRLNKLQQQVMGYFDSKGTTRISLKYADNKHLMTVGRLPDKTVTMTFLDGGFAPKDKERVPLQLQNGETIYLTSADAWIQRGKKGSLEYISEGGDMDFSTAEAAVRALIEKHSQENPFDA
jgi:hypothetical protein